MSLQRLPRYIACSRPPHYTHLIWPVTTPCGFINAAPSTSRGKHSQLPKVDPEQLSHIKHPTRAGQDLYHRYQRLERSLRGKTSYGREIQDLKDNSAPHIAKTEEGRGVTSKTSSRIFRGFVIPEPPKPPAEDECCMSGCAVCVYDLYEEARRDYVQVIGTMRAQLDKLGVAKSEWPADIRGDWGGSPNGPVSTANVALSAFEQLEIALKAKREQPVTGGRLAEASIVPPLGHKRPPKKAIGMGDVVEGLRWAVFSNR